MNDGIAQPCSTSSPGERLHALDALRAFVLLLGVVYHATLAYVAPPGIWAVGTTQPDLLLGWFAHFVHGFRMPVFFLLAGFFACLVTSRKGTTAYLRNRSIRVLLVFLVLLYPMKLLTAMPWIEGGLKTGWLQLPPEVAQRPLLDLALGGMNREKWPIINTGHLWFLYYLILIITAFFSLRALFGARVATAGSIMGRITAALWSRALAPAVLALLLTPALATAPRFLVDSPATSLMPEWLPSLIYSLYFCLGWWLSKRADLLSNLARNWLLLLGISVTLSFASVYCEILRITGTDAGVLKWPTALINSLLLCYAVAGWTGLFVARFSRPSRTARYLADAAYWVYLFHLPIVVALHVWVSGWTSVPLKFLFVAGVTLAASVLSYQLLVRHTFLGRWLNGRPVAPS